VKKRDKKLAKQLDGSSHTIGPAELDLKQAKPHGVFAFVLDG
jgi:hypothetical protein